MKELALEVPQTISTPVMRTAILTNNYAILGLIISICTNKNVDCIGLLVGKLLSFTF